MPHTIPVGPENEPSAEEAIAAMAYVPAEEAAPARPADTVFGDLTIAIDRTQAGVVRLFWQGKSNSRQPSAVLDPFLARVAEEARACGAEVEMHFERLEFFNSSTITSIIQFVQDMREASQKLLIVFNAMQKWQKLSFDALRIFEKGDGLLELRSIG